MYCQPIKINLFCNQCIFLDLQMGWRRYVLIYFPTTIFVLRPARWNTLYLGGPRTSLQMDGTLHLISFFLKIFLEVGSIRNHVHPGGWGGGGILLLHGFSLETPKFVKITIRKIIFFIQNCWKKLRLFPISF